MGIEFESWSEWIDTYDAWEFSVYPRIFAFAEIAWTEDKFKNYKDFYKRLEFFKTYMQSKGINYSRLEKKKFGVRNRTVFHLGERGNEYKYNEKINKLNNVEQCIVSRNNTFDQNDTYYYSIVKSYISSYDYTALQYDNKKDETTMDSSQLAEIDTEKYQALSNLESNEISTIEQQIETANEQIESLKSNISSVELQKKQTENSNNTDESDIKILTEKGNVSAEILTYEDKKQEYEAYLKDYDIKNNNCTIKAGTSGYFYTNKEISNGTYIQEGDSIGQIYPKEQSGYYAQVYVENSDIAKIKPDQEVKFEMASYPSSEYGYFTGTVKEIAKDVTVDQNTGNAYYVVKVECKNMEIKNKDGEKGNLKSGMAAQAKIVVDDDSVLHFVLSKINLVD